VVTRIMDRIDRDRLHLALIAIIFGLALVAVLRATGDPTSGQGRWRLVLRV